MERKAIPRRSQNANIKINNTQVPPNPLLPPSLPPGWHAKREAFGRPYYQDNSTVTTTWVHPQLLEHVATFRFNGGWFGGGMAEKVMDRYCAGLGNIGALEWIWGESGGGGGISSFWLAVRMEEMSETAGEISVVCEDISGYRNSRRRIRRCYGWHNVSRITTTR